MSNDAPPSKYADLTAALAQYANDNDIRSRWPVESIAALKQYDAFRWSVPKRFGGDGLPPTDALLGYEAVARGCLSTALIFTQHDAATDIILTGDNDNLKSRICPQLAAAEQLLTVGISQLTTSHQAGKLAMTVRTTPDGLEFTGKMPWVTAAAYVDAIVTGGVTPDNAQYLALMDRSAPGLTVGEPMKTAALQPSYTTSVTCDHTPVPASHIIRGPADKALSIRSTVRPLVVSATGLGLAGAMIDALAEITPRRSPELADFADQGRDRYQTVRRDLFAAAGALSDPAAEPATSVTRSAVNDLVIRLAVILLTLTKGSGYLQSHPAQRLARESFFFLVWSAPDPVQSQTLRNLLD
jgi:alkylation response protein AidB-like acyl-CoA dehydrogenase